tara:strand:- start:1133 stop:1270 length:138 start_codon:yes stop_codon:yes gene_type:complete
MNSEEILKELDDLIRRLKMRIIYLETENEKFKKRIVELKKFVKEK